MARRFLAWYRKYYLLVNLPVLFALLEVVLVITDPAHRYATDLDVSLSILHTSPPGNDPTVLLLGNSGIRLGVDEAQLAGALSTPGHPVRVYNFGVSSGRADDAFQVAKLLVEGEPKLKPAMVVLGVNAFLVDDHINPDSRFPWVKRRSPYIFYHRSLLRGMLKKVLRRRIKDTQMQQYAQEAGVQTFLHEFEHRPVSEFSLLDDVPELVAWLEAHGIPTYVVVLPMSPDGTSKLDNYATLMQAIRSKLPAKRLDLADAFPAASFKDVGHLNEAGRAQMTTKVATWLKTLPEMTTR